MRYNPTPNDGRGLYLPENHQPSSNSYFLFDVARQHMRTADGFWIHRDNVAGFGEVQFMTRDEALVLKATLKKSDCHVRLGH